LLLSKDFDLLVLIAFVMGVPVASYLIKSWLQRYAYHGF